MSVLRRRWRRILLLVVIAWLGVVAFLVSTAYADAVDGRAALERARDKATPEGLRDGAADTDLRIGADLLGSAHSKLANPLVQPFRLLPVAGRQLSSATALTDAGATVADTAADALPRARALDERVQTDRQGALRELASIATEARDRVEGIDLGPDEALIGQLATARNEVAEELDGIRTGLVRGAAGAEALSQLFSDRGNYLVVAANNAEMRAGAGMFLSAGNLTTGDGEITMGDMQTVGDVDAPAGSVVWPPELEALWGWTESKTDLRNLMLSPRFDVAAPLAAEIWRASGRGSVDGVLMIDPETLRAVLAATGPITTNGVTITAGNVLVQLLLEQYRAVSVTGSTADEQIARRDTLSGVARSAFEALNAGRWDPVTLSRELGRAAEGRHLLVWSRDPVLNEKWRTAGVGGTLHDDSLMVSMMNVGANKLDQFLDIDAEVGAVTGRSGLDFAVTVTIRNNAPRNGPRYVVGPTPGLGLDAGDYLGLLSVHVPGDATGLRFDGETRVVALGADGPAQVIATSVKIPIGETIRYVVRYTRPATATTTEVEPSGRVPPSMWTFGPDTWADGDARRIAH